MRLIAVTFVVVVGGGGGGGDGDGDGSGDDDDSVVMFCKFRKREEGEMKEKMIQ